MPTIAPLDTPASIAPVEAVNSGFSHIAGILVLLAGAAAVIYLMWAGIQYISSAGSPEKAKAARQGMINAIIGIIAVVSTYGIVYLATTIGKTLSNIAAGTAVTGGGTVGPTATTAPTSTLSPSPSAPPVVNAGTDATTLENLGFTQSTTIKNAAGDYKWCRDTTNCVSTLADIPTQQAPGIRADNGEPGTLTWYQINLDGENKWCHGDTGHCMTTAAFNLYTPLLQNVLDGVWGTASASSCTNIYAVVGTPTTGISSNELTLLQDAYTSANCTPKNGRVVVSDPTGTGTTNSDCDLQGGTWTKPDDGNPDWDYTTTLGTCVIPPSVTPTPKPTATPTPTPTPKPGSPTPTPTPTPTVPTSPVCTSQLGGDTINGVTYRFDYVKTDMNCEHRLALEAMTGSVIKTVKGSLGSYSTSRLKYIYPAHADKIKKVCGDDALACYDFVSRVMYLGIDTLNSSEAGSGSQDQKETIAHELIHSYVSLSSSNSQGLRPFNEMCAEYFGQEMYSTRPYLSYPGLVDQVPGIQTVFKDAGYADPEKTLKQMMYQDKFSEIDATIKKAGNLSYSFLANLVVDFYPSWKSTMNLDEISRSDYPEATKLVKEVDLKILANKKS